MTGEPLGPVLSIVLVAKGTCCLAYIGIGTGLFSARELLEWLNAGNYQLVMATVLALAGSLWALCRYRTITVRGRKSGGRPA